MDGGGINTVSINSIDAPVQKLLGGGGIGEGVDIDPRAVGLQNGEEGLVIEKAPHDNVVDAQGRGLPDISFQDVGLTVELRLVEGEHIMAEVVFSSIIVRKNNYKRSFIALSFPIRTITIPL